VLVMMPRASSLRKRTDKIVARAEERQFPVTGELEVMTNIVIGTGLVEELIARSVCWKPIS